MSKANFPAVMVEVFRHEGGYVDHPKDPGDATNLGITHRTLAAWRGRPVTKAEVRALTPAEAREIYRANYWNAVRGDDLPDGLDLVAMDGGVNSGPARGIRWLQAGVGAKVDGKIGPVTIAAAMRAPLAAVERACAARMGFLRALSHWSTFGRGWSRRVASVEVVGSRMWLEAAGRRNEIETTFQAREAQATAAAPHIRKNGTAAASATGGAGGAGSLVAPDIPAEAMIGLLGLVVVVVALIVIRSRRAAAYQEDRAAAYAAERKAMT